MVKTILNYLQEYKDVSFNDMSFNDIDASIFSLIAYLDKSDGPTKTILSYIKSLDLKPPENWDGYRVLTSNT